MIAKEIAAKVAQFEYELDFEVCKHTPQTWCKQESSADLCKQAPPMNSKVNSAARLMIVVAREFMGSWSYFKLQERG
jgi:hypothetical protein